MARSVCHALSIVLIIGLLPAVAAAGDVAGHIVISPAAVQATLGGPAPGAEARQAETGPILVYVAESESQLPRVPTTGERVRLSAGKAGPSFVAVSLGSVITFENGDRRVHRIRSRRGPMHFDLGRLSRGQTRELRAGETGIVSYECALHGDVRGEIVILAHSAFSVTDAAGNFHLRDLPPGRTTIVAYAPQLGEISREVIVPESETAEVEFAF